MAKKKSNNRDGSLCSGYRVFPDNSKCKGCIDCNFLKDKATMQAVFNRTHTTMRIGKLPDIKKVTAAKKKLKK